MVYWNIPVTPHLDEALEKAVTLNAHVSKSDFVRDSVRQKLEKMGLLVDQPQQAKDESKEA